MTTPRRIVHFADAAIASALAAWFAGTALGQHPDRSFDRIRHLDRLGCVLPNWRFFAPNPAVHDPTVLYRWLEADDSVSDWNVLAEVEDRRPRQIVWFPERRRDKAIIDMCTELQGILMRSTTATTHSPAYRLLRNMVEREVREATSHSNSTPAGFQFVVARAPGYDEGDDLVYMYASRLEPMT